MLRAILRQDPDVILLGEIRDLETAEVAFQAALTGHLVFSTPHTNSAIATIARLFDLGLKPYILASSLEGIISQRLVRRTCNHCSEPHRVDPTILQQLGPLFADNQQSLFNEYCANSGYYGCLCLFELLIPNEEMRDLIAGQAGLMEFKKVAIKSGYRPILEDALEKVIQGLTTCEEVLRVLGSQEFG